MEESVLEVQEPRSYGPTEVPLPLQAWLRCRNTDQGGRSSSGQNQTYGSTIITVVYTLEHTLRSHLSTFKLDIPSEVTVIGTGCKKNTFGEGRTPTIHLIEPGKCAGTEPHGSKPETTVGVLWGPDSFLFRSDILSKCPSKHTEIVMDSHSVDHPFI